MLTKLDGPSAATSAHQQLYAYWASLRAGAQLPSRRRLNPADMKLLLPTVSLIDVQQRPLRNSYRVRLAGTELYLVYGGETTGRSLDDVYSPPALDYWRRELDQVVRERRPSVGCHSLDWRGLGAMNLLWIRLPLASDGENVDMILGYDAIVGTSALRAHASSGVRAA